ncbi:hypothetical protein BDV26DRAFT_106635 [Aspergillus bertholletiae]|uniref:LysM domain-containing protein n=1 Tax=Aspergillus bertholletiae TaxID=1226010 RepID=A0A5N7BH60_9EURO|nr:hypothetical protein BDV26DRAFT_106635 [Aspergillus bertholletiae]
MRFTGPTSLTAFFVQGLLVSSVIARRNNINRCPEPCSLSINPHDWIDYHTLDRLTWCNETMILDFAIYTPLDDTDKQSTIFACKANDKNTIHGNDQYQLAVSDELLEETTLSLEGGTWGTHAALPNDDLTQVTINSVKTWLVGSPRSHQDHIFGSSGKTVVGLYIGSKIQRATAVDSVAEQMLKYIEQKGISSQIVLQHCGSNADYILGMVINMDGDLPNVQQSVRTWSDGQCVQGFDNEAQFSEIFVPVAPTMKASGLRLKDKISADSYRLEGRETTCDYIQVVSGDSCGSLVQKCGITAAELAKYNPDPNLCSTLAVGQYICCSQGDLPDFSPKPYPNGTCYTYQAQAGDYCAKIASEHSLSVDDIESFNPETWGWMGCNNLQLGQRLCLSKGDAPFPAPIANAVCGPQVPGTKQPGNDGPSLWVGLNPCPLNACCNVWGQCGITPEFCSVTKSPTGNPGTAAPGSNGCIDSCSLLVTNIEAPDQFATVGYFLGSNTEDRECLTLDAWFMPTQQFTHIQFGFGDIASDYSISVKKGNDQFNFFKSMGGFKKIISFGGWEFSTSPQTYQIFRQGVKEENRAKRVEMLTVELLKSTTLKP